MTGHRSNHSELNADGNALVFINAVALYVKPGQYRSHPGPLSLADPRGLAQRLQGTHHAVRCQ